MSDDDLRLPSGKELIVLELLSSSREMYGLEMVKATDGLARGTVYVLLNRMEDKGLVESRQEKADGMPGMPRRLYCITGLGQKTLSLRRQLEAMWADTLEPAGAT